MTTHEAPAAMSMPMFAAPPTCMAPTVNRAVNACSRPVRKACVVDTNMSPNPTTRHPAQNKSCASNATGAVGASIRSLFS